MTVQYDFRTLVEWKANLCSLHVAHTHVGQVSWAGPSSCTWVAVVLITKPIHSVLAWSIEILSIPQMNSLPLCHGHQKWSRRNLQM